MDDDLVISFQLLLCTLEFCIKRCPPELLQPLYSKVQDYCFFCHRISSVHVTKADKWLAFPYCSESAVSKVQSPPARAARRSQSKAKSRPLEPEVDLQLLKTLCQENDCNSEEVGGPSTDRLSSNVLSLHSVYIIYFSPLLRLQVKNVYQTSFTAFLDSLNLSGAPHFPQVRRSIISTPAPVFAFLSSYTSIPSLIPLPIATIEPVCDSCWLPPRIACLFSHL